ncbi:MAG: DNA-3-methyladenine glycosylase I [Calditrichaceae bacterium]|nr:DNA-3-methyladenine glycosylase I [Calditrichaceae bacterium]MBN2708764.1 DNA-3-methyladenine glycosylase I [Calditrichaceae bacterium]RQV97131.1 MAG: DNA-3-methyladenine glycosylase I [Calditrichota bacterium]
MLKRCDWVPVHDALYVRYHDEEWGVPVHEDRKLFEFLVLETFQAGLSWRTVLYKRENFRRAFENFIPEVVARYDAVKINSLCNDPGIIRNRLKINAAVENARAFLKIQHEFGSFDKYIWNYTNGRPVQNTFRKLSEIPSTTPLSDKISKDLRMRGFKFVGSTVCYAHMQATGMVNDHLIDCFRYQQVSDV